MTKKKKETAIVISLIVIVIAVALAYVLVVKHKDEKAAKESKKISLMQVDENLIKSIEISNGNGDFTFVKDNNQWVLKDDSDFTVDQDKVEEVVGDFTNIEADKNVGDVNGNVADFGLDKPSATGTLSLSDGTSVKVSIGTTVPELGGYYGMIQDVDGIYTFADGVFSDLLLEQDSFKLAAQTSAQPTEAAVQEDTESSDIEASESTNE